MQPIITTVIISQAELRIRNEIEVQECSLFNICMKRSGIEMMRGRKIKKNGCMFLNSMEDDELWLSELELEPVNSVTITVDAKMKELMLKCHGLQCICKIYLFSLKDRPLCVWFDLSLDPN